MVKIANNKKVLNLSNKIASAIEAEAEEILKDTEDVVKKYVPARKVKATLLKIEKALDKEGIETLFNKTVTREAIRKTASEEVSDKEIDELVDAIVEAVVDELEDVLKDADEVCDENVASFEDEDPFEVESKLKSSLEKKMASKGIYFKLARTIKKAPVRKASSKQTLLEKIRSGK